MEKNIKALLKSTRFEDHIVAIVTLNQYIDTQTKQSQTLSSRIYQLIQSIDHQLIITMIHTTIYPQIQQYGLNFLAFCAMDSQLSSFWTNELIELSRFYIYCTNAEIRHELALLLTQSSLLHDGNFIQQLIQHSLLALSSHQITYPTEIIHFLSDLMTNLSMHTSILPSQSNVSFPILHLSSIESIQLQELILQSLHGFIPETTRDQVIQHVLILFRSMDILSPQWMMKQELVSEAENNKHKTKKEIDHHFPQFICSIIAGEIKLLQEEIVYFYKKYMSSSTFFSSPSSSDNTDLNLHSNNSSNNLNSESVAPPSNEPTSKPTNETENKPKDKLEEKPEDNKHDSTRFHRAIHMMTICLQYLPMFYQLLLPISLETNEINLTTNDEMSTKLDVNWSLLSSTQLETIQKELYKVINILFACLQEIYENYQTIPMISTFDYQHQHQQNYQQQKEYSQALIYIISLIFQSIESYCYDDQIIQNTFVNHISLFFHFYIKKYQHIHSHDTSSFSPLSPFHHNKEKQSNTNNDNIYFFTFFHQHYSCHNPMFIICQILDTLFEIETSYSSSTSSNTKHNQQSQSNANNDIILELILEYFPNILSFVIHLLTFYEQQSYIDLEQINQTMVYVEMILSLIDKVCQSKEHDLRILFRGEGIDAFQSILHLSSSQLIEFYQILSTSTYLQSMQTKDKLCAWILSYQTTNK